MTIKSQALFKESLKNVLFIDKIHIFFTKIIAVYFFDFLKTLDK